MATKFEAVLQQMEHYTNVKISGPIDEDNELATLVTRLRGDLVTIDLAGVNEINSCGVRDWVKCREEIQARGITLILRECSPAIVARLNSVSNFIDDGYIQSFYAPYYCQACEMEKALLVDMDEMRSGEASKAPTCRCDECDGIMSFDDMEDSYFAFVQSAQKKVLPETIQQILVQVTTAGGERKILSSTIWSGSSFAGIPSSAAMQDFSTSVGSASLPSVNSLRRLRDKTGLRTMRKLVAEQTVSQPLALKKWIFIGSGLVLILVIVTLLFLLRT